MALRHLNFDSAIRGILAGSTGPLVNLLALATIRLRDVGLEPNLSEAITAPARHRRGPEKGSHRGADGFDERGIMLWIESVPATVPDVLPDDHPEHGISKEIAAMSVAARENLVKIHATLAALDPAIWAKVKADPDNVGGPLV
jgi:hypothetical protein